ncbi:MAG: hypothetical protein LBP74_06460 [Treponema sp.]|jgi:hypothetical protein|nr:hypothetical protein [Treponema sp.]
MSTKSRKMIYLLAGIVVLILAACNKSLGSGGSSGQVTIKVSTRDGENSYSLRLREAFAKAYPK